MKITTIIVQFHWDNWETDLGQNLTDLHKSPLWLVGQTWISVSHFISRQLYNKSTKIQIPTFLQCIVSMFQSQMIFFRKARMHTWRKYI